MTNNMYRVGDYVYFETSSTSPYQIRRIEELNKTPSGNVEAKVMCFYRRRDVSSSLIVLADKHQNNLTPNQRPPPSCSLHLIRGSQATNFTAQGALEEEDLEECENSVATGVTTTPSGEVLNYEERHQLRHRELFLSRQIETLPATHIRGKCTVTLLNETEALLSYLNKEDMFFYSLVYDPQQKTLLADKGEIRVGSRYQSDITTILKEGEGDGRRMEDLEHLIWTPTHGLTDRQIDQFLVISRSVGTFARALDCSSSVKQPSLHMSAAAASRDVTLFHAMDTLHKHHYDLSKAVCSLVPSSGPVLCRDEMEEWSASEANLFEEALEKYGKDFNDIRQDFLPWKTLKNIIEYYYMWKTTDRYVQQKRVKAVEAESKLKQVYIPNYNKPNPAVLANGKSAMVNGNGGAEVQMSGKPCESCQDTGFGPIVTPSSQWFAWGPASLQCRLCSICWMYWKKFGGLKLPSKIAREEDGSLIYTPVPNREIPTMNTSSSLLKRRAYEETNGMDGVPPHKKPCKDSAEALDPYHLSQLGVNPPPGLTVTPVGLGVNGGPVVTPPEAATPPPLPSQLQQQLQQQPPPPPPQPQQHPPPPPPPPQPQLLPQPPPLLATQLPLQTQQPQTQQPLPLLPPPPSAVVPPTHSGGGRAKIATVSRVAGRPRIISWMDAPDDVYFYASESTKKLRRTLTTYELKRAARRPFRRVPSKEDATE